jgi:hypothetical protein
VNGLGGSGHALAFPSANSTMNPIRCQHEWVKQCQLRYRVEPPAGYHFEEAHYPLSKRLGGTETVSLWYPDHIVQGVLQTLELKWPCIDTRKYKQELQVLKETYPDYEEVYQEAYKFCKKFQGEKLNKKNHEKKTESGKSEHAVNAGKKSHDRRNAEGKSLHALNTIVRVHKNRDEMGRSLLGVANAERLHSQKDENGKSIVARKSGLKNLINKEKDELGRSVNAVKAALATNREKNEKGKSINATKAAKVMNTQVWESTMDGFRSNAGNVARHNMKNGWAPTAKIRVQ